ncbi:hypothetical protein [Alicyclobacillus pomorum]|uniref:hypothetical protein n=1 Tax=Alicyclobacillus pomorum TaxID=204470 RepID=UPI0003F8CF4F|nr:hypothetical protein [Alicyclobacillus pomorum]
MIWLALVTVICIAAVDTNSLRQASRHEITVYAALVVLALAMSSLVSWHLWSDVHLIAPFDAMFGSMTKWLYEIL